VCVLFCIWYEYRKQTIKAHEGFGRGREGKTRGKVSAVPSARRVVQCPRFRSGFNRPLGLCEYQGRSWREPNNSLYRTSLPLSNPLWPVTRAGTVGDHTPFTKGSASRTFYGGFCSSGPFIYIYIFIYLFILPPTFIRFSPSHTHVARSEFKSATTYNTVRCVYVTHAAPYRVQLKLGGVIFFVVVVVIIRIRSCCEFRLICSLSKTFIIIIIIIIVIHQLKLSTYLRLPTARMKSCCTWICFIRLRVTNNSDGHA